MQLLALSLAAALPILVILRRSASRPGFQRVLSELDPILSSRGFFGAGVIALAGLYTATFHQSATFDEFMYALGLREMGLFPGHNHFLGHFLGYAAYLPLRSWTSDTKRL